MPRQDELLKTPDNRDRPWTISFFGMLVGAVFYWGLLQFPGMVLQGALRLPGRLVIGQGLEPLLGTAGVALPELVAVTLGHLLCIVPFAALGAAVFARERIWATVVGLVLAFALGLAMIFVWRAGG
jgi:hypothetical protein